MLSGLKHSGSARFAPARSGASAAPLAPWLRSVASGCGAWCAREPPAPLAGEALTCVPISDARAGTRAPPLGAPSPEAALATREGAVDSGARNAHSLPPCLAMGQGRVHERLVLWLAAAVTRRRTTTESNRCSGMVLRTVVPRSHGTEHATPCCRISGCVEQSFLPEGTRARCVERGRANPVCQRAPESHLDGPLAGLPDSRGQLASRRAARFGHPRESRHRCLLPVSCLREPLLTIREPLPRVRLAAVARCRAPNPLCAEHA